MVVPRARAPSSTGTALRAHCAPALAPFKVPKRAGLHRRAAAAHRLGQAAAQGAGDELRRERLPRRAASADGRRRRVRLDPPPGADARVGAASRTAMIDAVAPQPGERVLELAAGPRRDRDARRRAGRARRRRRDLRPGRGDARREPARGPPSWVSANVEFKVLNAEWIDLPLASVDIVLCRWGYMLMADPAAALGETRRVLRPGGRAGAGGVGRDRGEPVGRSARGRAARARPDARRQPRRRARAVRARQRAARCGAARAGRFRRDRDRAARDDPAPRELRGVLGADARPLAQLPRRGALAPEAEIDEIREALASRLAPFTAADGSLALPGRTLVAGAEA